MAGPAAAAAAGAAAGGSSGATAASVGSTVAGSVSGGIGLVSAIGNIIQNYKARMQNQENWEKSFEYQKQLNNLLMQREDTAIQRRAADLAAAGINPMLAGLGGASAQPGGIINPLIQQPNPIDASAAVAGMNQLSNSLSKQNEIEKQTATEKEINAESINANKAINTMNDFIRLAEARINANSAKEIKELENEMKWKIETHKAIKELIGATGIPALDVIIKDFVDGFTGNESLDLLKEKINELKKRIKTIKEENLIDENADTLHLGDVGNGILEKLENGIKNLPEKLKEDWIKALNSKPARKVAELWGRWLRAKNEEKEKIMEQVRK